MSARPPQIVSVTAGKSLGAAIHKGWAATWNWMLSWVNHFTAGNGCTLENAETGHPRLDVLLEEGDGISITGGGKGQAYVISATGGGGSGGGEGDGEGSGGVTSITGNDSGNTSVAITGALTFAKATDTGKESNVEVTTEAASGGGGTMKVGVYYV